MADDKPPMTMAQRRAMFEKKSSSSPALTPTKKPAKKAGAFAARLKALKKKEAEAAGAAPTSKSPTSARSEPTSAKKAPSTPPLPPSTPEAPTSPLEPAVTPAEPAQSTPKLAPTPEAAPVTPTAPATAPKATASAMKAVVTPMAPVSTPKAASTGAKRTKVRRRSKTAGDLSGVARKAAALAGGIHFGLPPVRFRGGSVATPSPGSRSNPGRSMAGLDMVGDVGDDGEVVLHAAARSTRKKNKSTRRRQSMAVAAMAAGALEED